MERWRDPSVIEEVIMQIQIGQFVLAVLPGLYVRVPRIGALWVGGGMPFAWDRWSSLRSTGEVR
jgi:hypothetical protein